MPDLEIQESKTSGEKGIISKYKVPLAVGGVAVIAAVGVLVAYITGFIGSTTPPDDSRWATLESCKYSALTADLRDFASKNKSKAPANMKSYLDNMELYDFAITLTDTLPIESSSGPDCEKLASVKKVMDLQYFDISPEKKKIVKSLVRKCKKEGLLPTSDEKDYEPIIDFLNENASPSILAISQDEDVRKNFEDLEKLTEDERDAILGEATNGFKQVLFKKGFFELLRKPKESPEIPSQFQKNSALYVQFLNSPDKEFVYVALALLNQFFLNGGDSPPIEDVLNLRVLPQIVSFLSDVVNTSSELEVRIVSLATGILLIVATGNHEQTSCVVNAGAVPLLVANVLHPNSDIRVDSITTLGNIALDCIEFRDMLLDTKILENLLKAVQMEQSSSTINFKVIYEASWILNNLASALGGKYPIWTKVKGSISIIDILLKVGNEEALVQVSRALSRLVYNPGMVTSEMTCLLEQINQLINNSTNLEIKFILTDVASKITK